MIYLLDTKVLSEPLRPKPDPVVIRRIQQHLDAIAVAAPSWHELVTGASGFRRKVCVRSSPS